MFCHQLLEMIKRLCLLCVPVPCYVLLEENPEWSRDFGETRDKLGEVGDHAQEPLKFFLVCGSFHVCDSFDLLGIWFNSFFTEDMAKVADFLPFNLAFLLVKLEISRPCMLEDFFQSHVVLFLINTPDKNIVNNDFNTFSVLEYL